MDLHRASTHYNGLGIQEGIDFHSTMYVLRTLKDTKYPLKYPLKCALETVISAGAWPEDRIHQIHPSVSAQCKRCGGPVDDALHTFWLCPANEHIEDRAVETTQCLIPAAQQLSVEYPCLWLRGILPSKFTDIDPQYDPSNELSVTYINNSGSEIIWGSGTYYGDASGGEFSSYPAIRRIGCGLSCILDDGSLSFGAHFNLPGTVQTVPRGELYALVVLVGLCQPMIILNMLRIMKGSISISVQARVVPSNHPTVTYIANFTIRCIEKHS